MVALAYWSRLKMARLKVTEVLSGSPAEKVGIKTDDIITHINGKSVSGLTPEQVNRETSGTGAL